MDRSGTAFSSLASSQGSSRSTSPSAPNEKSRTVSGSLQDRIAKFNNPAASPLVPTRPFGQAGPAHSTAPVGRSGLIGNRLPTIDPKTAGMVGGQRRSSENKGLIGNRIPSMGNIPKPSAGRSASPAGSIDSSVASAAAGSSTSPVTSRSSSPPTSPGGGLPPSLLASTLPDDGGPGAATPSSTVAEAGEETSELSVPSTPLAGPNSELPPTISAPLYDLVPSNLKLAAAEQMQRGLSTQSAAKSFAPSVSSSLAAQYGPSSGGNDDQITMMDDVSGISTPMGTPRAARRDLEGSARGEGSVAGDADIEELGTRLEGIDVDSPEEEQHITHNKNDDPNDASDLDALKRGELQTGGTRARPHGEMNIINEMAELGMMQNVDEPVVFPEEKKVQGGEAGKRTNDDFDNPEPVKPPTPPANSSNGENQQKNEKGSSSDEGTADRNTKGATQWFESQADGEDEKGHADGDSGQRDESDKGDREKPPSADTVTPVVNFEDVSEHSIPAPVHAGSQGETAKLSSDQTFSDPSSHKPIQVQLEPAPTAQPADDATPDTKRSSLPEVPEMDDVSSRTDIPPPSFPSAPSDDPYALQPGGEDDPLRSGTSTPIDPTFMRSFPHVPDEDKPRVEVHVSTSPAITPHKAKSSPGNFPETPLADLPGHSKSLSSVTSDDQQTPSGSRHRDSLGLDPDNTPQQGEGAGKRLSMRKSPKSPLLDDEDPGDFEPGEGWAVVTK